MTAALRQLQDRSRYQARMAVSPADLAACQALRHRAFFGSAGTDCDAFDPLCRHLMVHDMQSGAVVATARLALYETGGDVLGSYAAQFYDLTEFASHATRAVEVGRFCVQHGGDSGDILRMAWAFLTRFVDAHDVALLFGCTSFAGTDPSPYAAALATLHARHTGPADRRPARKAGDTVALDRFSGDARVGVAQMPPLLTTYLKMGGWVSDHAVIDPAMNTLHVFTALEISQVPPARAKTLRALAASL